MSRLKKEILSKLKEYAGKMGKDHLGGDDSPSPKRGGLRDFDGYDNVDYNKDMPMDEDSPESAHPQGSKKLSGRTTVMDMLDVISHKEFGPDYHKLSTKQKKEVHKMAIKGKLIKQSPFNESLNEREGTYSTYDEVVKSIVDFAKSKGYKIPSKGLQIIKGNPPEEPFRGWSRGTSIPLDKKINLTFQLYGVGKVFTVHQKLTLNKKFALESVNEGKVDRVVGHTRYKYVGDGRKGKAIVSGPMKDREKEAIIKRAKKAGYVAKPNMGGGVTIHVESINEAYVVLHSTKKGIKPVATAAYRDKKDAEKWAKSLGGITMIVKQKMKGVDESLEESMFSAIDQIRQDSKDVRDFVKNVFKDREFKKMSNDKEFIKYLKSIYEGINEAIPQNFQQGRTSDYHTALRGKNRDYSGGTNFKKKNHGQPDIEEDDEDQETNQLSNKQIHVKAKLKVAESGKKKSEKNYKDWKSTNEGFDKIEHLSLLNKALRAIPGSNKQKDIIRQLNVIRKAGGMRPLKELSIVEYGQRLDLSFIEDEEAKLDGTYPSTDAIDRDIDETAKRDYKDEYKKFQSSKKSKKYRAELNKYNRDKGTYGNGDGKDASHKGGKIVGFESASKNRGRKEKSRLKKK